ncbi:MAG: S41 family peptidase [Phycisphaerales bacterium]|nr:S41 family peptidase [Phycisphaerales bacterium]
MDRIRPLRRRRTSALLLTASAACLTSSVLHAQVPLEQQPTTTEERSQIAVWSDAIWSAALAGDLAGVEAHLSNIPDAGLEEQVGMLRDLVESRRLHLDEAANDRTDDLEEAREEMRSFIEEDKIVEALSSAVAVQTHSDDFADALAEEAMQDLIREADDDEAGARAVGDWLLAQDLLYRLRTLFDEGGDGERYRRYKEQLDDVNRRIGFLAQYAPRSLHELRRSEMARYAPEKMDEFPEYNEEFADDWKELLEDVNERVLRNALRLAAREHISGSGWKPLLVGGIEALRIFVTTEALKENFPSIGSTDKVERFDDFLMIHEDRIRDMPSDAVDADECRKLLREIMLSNDRTLQLDKALIIRQFGDGAMYQLEREFQDEYSQIIWPDQLRRFQQQVNGAFVGIGILIRYDDRRQIMVVNPLEGSPAARAGVKAGDLIANVDGASTLGWSLNRAVDEITGPIGENVELKITREGFEEPIAIAIPRDQIKMRSVNGWWKNSLDPTGEPDWNWYIDEDAGIGYIRLTSFNEDSFTDFLGALDEMHRERAVNGLILDLRYNPGGLLRSAVEFSNLFVDGGPIVSGENRLEETVWELSAEPGRAILKDIPTVVLVNQGSASASEIVAGALQAHASAVILGQRSFGKGSVQTVHDLSSPFSQAAVKLTTQYYVLPPVSAGELGRHVHKRPGAVDWGVNPDIEVQMGPEQIEEAISLRQKADLIAEWIEESEREPRPDVEPLIASGKDPQLEMALLLLRARSLKDLEQDILAEGG